MKRLSVVLVLVLFAVAVSVSACGENDPDDRDQDGDTVDGDGTDTDGDAVSDGDVAVDGDVAADGDATDQADPFAGLNCEVKTPACNLWYCNAQKGYDRLYSRCVGDHPGISDEKCAGYKVCADEFKACITPYRSQCVGDSVPPQLATKCTVDLSKCEADLN